MSDKSRSGSEKRKLKNKIDVRLDDEIYASVVHRAEALKVTNASIIRDILLDEFGTTLSDHQQVVRKKNSNRKPNDAALAAMQFIAELRRVGNNYNQSVRNLNIARRAGDMDEQLFRELKVQQDHLAVTFNFIKQAVAGVLDLDDD